MNSQPDSAYFDTLRAILAAGDLTPSAKLVVIYLHDKIGKNGHCWPPLVQIMRGCTLSRHAVVDAIHRAEDHGYLIVTRPEKPSCRQANEYSVRPVPKAHRLSTENQYPKRTGTSTQSAPQRINNES